MSIAFPMSESRCSLDSLIHHPRTPRPRRRKTTSAARINANRENARRSTGPRTAEGKRRSSQNALKHGCCADYATLPNECSATHQTFVRELEEELRPRTIMQRTLFPQICNLIWRLQRLPDSQTKIFAHESKKAGDPHQQLAPCEILARRFSDDKNNGFILMDRYERSMQNALMRLLRQYEYLKKHHPVAPNDPNEKPVPREGSEPAWTEEKMQSQLRWFAERKHQGKDWADLRDEYLRREDAELRAERTQSNPTENVDSAPPPDKSPDMSHHFPNETNPTPGQSASGIPDSSTVETHPSSLESHPTNPNPTE